MTAENSLRKVLIGASLQGWPSSVETWRGSPEPGPATHFIIPASQVLMDAKRAFSMLKAENAQWITGAVPLAYNVPFPLTIFGYPDKSFMGELMAMAIGLPTTERLDSIGLASFIASSPGTPGLNDAVAGGEYSGACDRIYTVKISAIVPVDTITIKIDDGAFGEEIPLTSEEIDLGDGVTILFGATIGHSLGDIWQIKAFNSLAYKHTFVPADVPVVSTFWLYENAGQLKASDVVCNKLNFKIAQNKEGQVTSDLIGGSIAIATDMGTPTASDYPDAEDPDKIFRSGIATLVYGETGAAIRTNLTDIDIAISRGIKAEEGLTQDAVSNKSMYPEENLLTVTLDFLLTDLVELQRSWDGKTIPTATSPDWKATKLPACDLRLKTLKMIDSSVDSSIPNAGNTGPNDLTTAGAFTGAANAVYSIKISTAAATDKFQVKKDDGAYGAEIAMTGAPQDIGDGIIISFGAISGHILNDLYTINAKSHNYELGVILEHGNIQFTPGQSGGRRKGKLIIQPIANPAEIPYQMYLVNTEEVIFMQTVDSPDIGYKTDAPASVSADETAAANSLIAIIKALKNLDIDAVGHLASIEAISDLVDLGGSQRLPGNGASQALTVPANTRVMRVDAEGGAVRISHTGAASATTIPRVPEEAIDYIPLKSADAPQFYGASSAIIANINYYGART